MTRITKDTTIGEAIQYDAGIVSILMGESLLSREKMNNRIH